MQLLKKTEARERPRERLRNFGSHALKDTELLAILLGTGTKNRDVLQLANEVLPIIDSHWEELDAARLQKFTGIGEAKAGLVIAALEFVRRRIRPQGVKIGTPKDVIPLVSHLADRKQEHFICVSLNGAHEVIAVRVITIGLVNSAQVHPREVFSDALCDRACAVILAHNHPSGSLTPSDEDLRVTRTLKKAGDILGIKVLDHIIFSMQGFYSFADTHALD